MGLFYLVWFWNTVRHNQQKIKLMKNLMLIACLFILGLTKANAQVKFETFDWNALTEKAAKENKLIMVDMTATWCYWCKQMDKKVFPDKAVGEFYNSNFISTKLYDTDAMGKEFAQKYKVQGFPCFLFLDSEGKLVHRIDGAIVNGKDFIAEGKTIKKSK
jgi:thioredoxin-related protein